MVKNLPCNAGDSGSIPDQGTKIPHPAEQLSPLATIKGPPCTETKDARDARKILGAATKTKSSPINQSINQYFFLKKEVNLGGLLLIYKYTRYFLYG